MTDRRVLRPVGSEKEQRERLARLRSDMLDATPETAPPEHNEEGVLAGSSLDDLVDRKLQRLLSESLDTKDLLAALKVAVGYLAVKNKVPPQWGTDLGEIA